MNKPERTSATADERTFKIGELAQEFDVTLRTLRFYEDKGLLSPERVGNTRIYSRGDRARLKIILAGKRVGLSLSDASELLALYDPSNGNIKQISCSIDKGERQLEKLYEDRKQLDATIVELQKALASLRDLISQSNK